MSLKNLLVIFLLSFSFILPVQAASEIGLPVRLKIPKIKVNAIVESVGLLPNGAMGVPKIPRNAGWYKLGPRPGEIGSAAIAGHLNWWNGAVSVFAKLSKLKLGDKIIVQDKNGIDIVFVVRKISLLGSQEDASEVFVSDDGMAHLNLITCGGTWNKITKQYSKRLVIFADKE
ncbi:MAG: peptidase C60 sortase A and B [uncultured bacterium]|uniref:class F sortase n=1 Tax=Sediminibacterium sp. TaxID=1917865 RepID=UPI000285BE87|nr:class F sortase [Sediminibacterium sp.]EKD43442.1 MAG: peptidase C60 sortase A and B [uncultured bacterium]HLD54619.1 class F sortase [Sediminibacterium sp.]